ncbi:hypothetical protein B0H13DRAFT_1866571 [Mycena leptocephala]|nr:hypothetical protein B0H13DRAFT_1866571 [Mycena leptocephala]
MKISTVFVASVEQITAFALPTANTNGVLISYIDDTIGAYTLPWYIHQMVYRTLPMLIPPPLVSPVNVISWFVVLTAGKKFDAPAGSRTQLLHLATRTWDLIVLEGVLHTAGAHTLASSPPLLPTASLVVPIFFCGLYRPTERRRRPTRRAGQGAGERYGGKFEAGICEREGIKRGMWILNTKDEERKNEGRCTREHAGERRVGKERHGTDLILEEEEERSKLKAGTVHITEPHPSSKSESTRDAASHASASPSLPEVGPNEVRRVQKRSSLLVQEARGGGGGDKDVSARFEVKGGDAPCEGMQIHSDLPGAVVEVYEGQNAHLFRRKYFFQISCSRLVPPLLGPFATSKIVAPKVDLPPLFFQTHAVRDDCKRTSNHFDVLCGIIESTPPL